MHRVASVFWQGTEKLVQYTALAVGYLLRPIPLPVCQAVVALIGLEVESVKLYQHALSSPALGQIQGRLASMVVHKALSCIEIFDYRTSLWPLLRDSNIMERASPPLQSVSRIVNHLKEYQRFDVIECWLKNQRLTKHQVSVLIRATLSFYNHPQCFQELWHKNRQLVDLNDCIHFETHIPNSTHEIQHTVGSCLFHKAPEWVLQEILHDSRMVIQAGHACGLVHRRLPCSISVLQELSARGLNPETIFKASHPDGVLSPDFLPLWANYNPEMYRVFQKYEDYEKAQALHQELHDQLELQQDSLNASLAPTRARRM